MGADGRRRGKECLACANPHIAVEAFSRKRGGFKILACGTVCGESCMQKSTLLKMTAKDIMQKDVVVVAPGDTLQEAMSLMTENHVTGLPVMDSRSRCVGLISSTDILNYEQEHTEFTSEANANLAQHFNADTQRWESVRVTSFALEEFGDVRVEEVMSTNLVSVMHETPIRDVAAKMLQEKIHRVLVLDDQFHLFGIISATDFVRLFAEL
jgi:CBS domain-containing protein